ncbi:uncharacterized protein LOC110636597 [Hevea brasiliensis]|uniref:uncharacterized protein LOC110636597 n=1 Tax=Hevea brasiliensis TaxID=3981 RepID=UPI0025F4F129|nr:uncharacterized protein LOC110636597 [Hevea brasiliensis]
METFSVKVYSSVIGEGNKEPCKGYFDAPTVPIFSGKIGIQRLEGLKVEWNILKGIWPEMFQAGFLNSLKVIELLGLPVGCAHLLLDFLQRLPNLEKLVLSDSLMEETFLDELNIHNKENPRSLAQLKGLVLSKLPKLRCMVNTQPFENLKNLEVSKCHGMINLITSTAARRLVQLTQISVTDCEIIQEIVASVGDEVADKIWFSHLKYLELRRLPCLTSFSFGYYTFIFQSLREVIITECPQMKTFAQGRASTPTLRKMQADGEVKFEFEWNRKGNLNEIIQESYKRFTGMDDEEN